MNKFWQQLAIATNWPILVAVGVLSSLGVISIWADDPRAGAKQAIYLCIAFGCMALFQVVNYQKLGRWAWPFYIFSFMLVAYTVLGTRISGLPGVRPIKGACAWINFGPMSLEPAELLKVGFIMVLAKYLRWRSNYRTLTGLLPPFALALIPMGVIMKQPDLGVAIIFVPTLFIMLFVAGAKVRHLLTIVAMGSLLIPLAWFAGTSEQGVPHSRIPGMRHLPELLRQYQRDRVLALFSNDPGNSQKGGYQLEHALTAFGSGGITGKGLGNVPLGKKVPEGHNDMILALIGEQFGLVGTVALLGAYLVLFVAGIEVAAATKEPFGRLLAIGIVASLAAQTFINLMVAMRVIPVTGITLPFVSYGGSSLLASFLAAGLLLNVGQNRPLVIARDGFEFAG